MNVGSGTFNKDLSVWHGNDDGNLFINKLLILLVKFNDLFVFFARKSIIWYIKVFSKINFVLFSRNPHMLRRWM